MLSDTAGWFGLGQGLDRTPGPTVCAPTRTSRLGRATQCSPVARPPGLLTAPLPPRGHMWEGDAAVAVCGGRSVAWCSRPQHRGGGGGGR